MAPFPIIPSEPSEQRADSPTVDLAGKSLESIVFLFQVLMALSLTNGAYIFVTGGNGGYALRPWTSFTLYQSLVFLVFVATLIPFAHANVLIFHQSYGSGFTDKGLQPIVDFFLLFLEAGIFYTLSDALTRIDHDYLSFFYVAGAILIVDVVWALVTYAFDRTRRVVLVYAILNTATLVLGGLLVSQNTVHPRELLLLTLGIRTTLDYSLTYTFLFPNAFKQFTAGGTGSIRNLSIAAALFIGCGALLPFANLGASLDAFHLPLLYLGIILEAAAWVLSVIRAASTKEWVWLVGILVYTTIIPLIGEGLVASEATRIAGTALLMLAPLVTFLYGVAYPK